jgi:hypothetical protein
VISDTDRSIQELARYLLPSGSVKQGTLPVSVIQGVVVKGGSGGLELFLPHESGHAGAFPTEGSSNQLPITGVRYLNSYRPYAGDVVYCIRVGTDTFVLGSLNPKNKPDIWHEVGSSGEPALQNSWVWWGSIYETPAFWKQSDGWVHLKGLVKNGSSATAVIFTLPVGYRPKIEQYFGVMSNGGSAVVVVRTTGAVECFIGGNTAYICLDGIMFPSESAWNRDEWQTPRMDNNQPQSGVLGGGDIMLYTRPYDGVVFVQGVWVPTVNSPLFAVLELPEKTRRHRFYEMMPADGGAVVARMAVGGLVPGFLQNDSGATAGFNVYLGGITWYGQMSYHLDDEWIPFPFATGWANYANGWTSVAYRKDSQGVVWLSGLSNRTGGTGLIGTLPVGYRPARTQIFKSIQTTDSITRIDVNADGTVNSLDTLGNGYHNLNGIKFRAMQ